MSFFIHTEADLDTAIAGLVAADARFGEVLARAGRPPLRRRADGFAGLASIVVSQQVSTASAKAIWGRLAEALDPLDHTAVLRARPRAGAPASAPKIRTLKALARRSIAATSICPRWSTNRPTSARRADLAARHRPVDRRHLSPLLPRPRRHLAGRRSRVQEATKLLLALKTRRPAGTGPLAEAWRPWRGAALMLWTYYRAHKQREGAPISQRQRCGGDDGG